MPKQLVVNADDFGLTVPITDGTIQAIENGVVTSVSVTANGDDFERARDYLAAHPHVSAGWHINLTSGRPVHPGNRVAGLFAGKGALLRKVVTGAAPLDVIKDELTAQWEKMAASGLRVTHIDSHHDVHIWPGLRRTLAGIVKDTPAPFVRFCGSRLYEQPIAVNLEKATFILTKWLVNKLTLRHVHRKDVDFIQFRELYQLENKRIAVYSYINQLASGTTLLICHPGWVDHVNRYSLNYNAQREKELEALCDPEVMRALQQHRVRLVSYRDLLDGERT